MTPTVMALIAAGLAGIALTARLQRLAETRFTDAAAAGAAAETALVGFRARDAVIATDGNVALVAGDGSLAAIRRSGTRIAVRRLLPPLRLMPAVEGVTIFTGDSAFGDITLFGVTDAEVRTLEAQALT